MFEFFDRVYCIHLPNAERWKLIEAQFERVDISDPSYVFAQRPPADFTMSNMRRAPGAEFGVNLSQLKAIMHAIADGAERPLFVEDDVVFCENAPDRLRSAVSDLPPDWDVLYLGGHPRGKARRVGEGLVKVSSFSFAEAYSIQRKSLLPFASYWCDRIGKPNAMYDFVLSDFAATCNSFAAYPLITEQPPGISQISGRMDDKRDLVRRGWAANLVA